MQGESRPTSSSSNAPQSGSTITVEMRPEEFTEYRYSKMSNEFDRLAERLLNVVNKANEEVSELVEEMKELELGMADLNVSGRLCKRTNPMKKQIDESMQRALDGEFERIPNWSMEAGAFPPMPDFMAVGNERRRKARKASQEARQNAERKKKKNVKEMTNKERSIEVKEEPEEDQERKTNRTTTRTQQDRKESLRRKPRRICRLDVTGANQSKERLEW